MNYLAILGRQPEISLAELEALFSDVRQIAPSVAQFKSTPQPNINRLGGSIKLAQKLPQKPLEYLSSLPDGKLTLGFSDYSTGASHKTTSLEALKIKKILTRHGRSIRIVESKSVVLSTATSLHNGLSGKNPRKLELIKFNNQWFRVIGIQDIDAYSKRDQTRPARDARVGMLPPKLAQILINLCGPLPEGSTILDPFCGTGVVLQEALLMGYRAYGTDLSEKMTEYTVKNLKWLTNLKKDRFEGLRSAAARVQAPAARGDGPAGRGPRNDFFQIELGDAVNHKWSQPIDAIACEGYLGRPMSQIPPEIKLKTEKQECNAIIIGFLKNLAKQIKPDTPVTIAIPAWLRENGSYSRLDILDEINEMGYNVSNKSREGLIYHRDSQIVARDIIILRKK